MNFTYEAKDENGKTVTGVLDAESERVAANKVRELGYYPMRFASRGGSGVGTIPRTVLHSEQVLSGDGFPSSVFNAEQSAYSNSSSWADRTHVPHGSWFMRKFVYPIWTGIGQRDLAVFYRTFSAMINAGVPIYQTLDTLSTQTPSPLFRTALSKIAYNVRAGDTLASAFSEFPYIFSELQRSMIASAETTGHIDVMLARMADYLERDLALRLMIRQETMYPKLVLAGIFLIPTAVIAVVSGMGAYFTQAVMPLLEILATVGLVWGAGRYALQVESNKVIYDTIKAFLPYFGNTIRMLSLAKFARAFALLYSSGVLIPRGITIAAKVAGNAYYVNAIGKAADALNAGDGLTQALASTKAFPPVFLSMVSTGETTGNLDQMLNKIADLYDGEAAVRLHQSVRVLGVLLLILAGVAVCIVLLNGYQAIFAKEYGSLLSPDSGQ